jgi:uncharacterized membrane protein
MASKVWNFLKYLIALFLIYGGVQHFVKPTFYLAFVPDFIIYKTLVIYISGFAEIICGLLVFIPKYAFLGMFGIFILMIVFLPVHVLDIFSETPAMGSSRAAYVRLVIQFMLIALTGLLSKRLSTEG